MPQVTVRYFAGARAAAGIESEIVEAATVSELVQRLGAARGSSLTRTLTACSFLVNGQVARDPATALPPGATVDVLPPFAGG